MTKDQAIEYLEKVLENWTNWHCHHKNLIEAIEVLLEVINGSENRDS